MKIYFTTEILSSNCENCPRDDPQENLTLYLFCEDNRHHVTLGSHGEEAEGAVVPPSTVLGHSSEAGWPRYHGQHAQVVWPHSETWDRHKQPLQLAEPPALPQPGFLPFLYLQL